MTILTKEIDIYHSILHKGKTISEYIIYLMVDNTPIEAYIEIGEDARDRKISRLKSDLNITHPITNHLLIL